MFLVRRALPSERLNLLPVWRSAVEATHHFLSAADIDWYEPHVRAHLLADPDLRIAVPSVERDAPVAEPLGFISHDGGAIQMLFVDARAHGKGVGSALLAAVVEECRRPDGSYDVTVDVNEDNASGRSFYLARGFEPTGRSDEDEQGRPFPLLHLRLHRPASVDGARADDGGRS